MKTTRKRQPVITSPEMADAFLHDLALVQNQLKQIEVEMTEAIQEIRAKRAADIASLKKAQEANMRHLERWAEANPELFPKDGPKKLQLTCGEIGFVACPPKVKCLPGHSETSVVDHLSASNITWVRNLLRIEYGINKEAVITLSAAPSGPESLATLGLVVRQDEAFVCNPCLEEVQ